MNDQPELDLIVDLNTMDNSGLPWAFISDAQHPERVVARSVRCGRIRRRQGRGPHRRSRRRHCVRPALAWLSCEQRGAPDVSSACILTQRRMP